MDVDLFNDSDIDDEISSFLQNFEPKSNEVKKTQKSKEKDTNIKKDEPKVGKEDSSDSSAKVVKDSQAKVNSKPDQPAATVKNTTSSTVPKSLDELDSTDLEQEIKSFLGEEFIKDSKQTSDGKKKINTASEKQGLKFDSNSTGNKDPTKNDKQKEKVFAKNEDEKSQAPMNKNESKQDPGKVTRLSQIKTEGKTTPEEEVTVGEYGSMFVKGEKTSPKGDLGKAGKYEDRNSSKQNSGESEIRGDSKQDSEKAKKVGNQSVSESKEEDANSTKTSRRKDEDKEGNGKRKADDKPDDESGAKKSKSAAEDLSPYARQVRLKEEDIKERLKSSMETLTRAFPNEHPLKSKWILSDIERMRECPPEEQAADISMFVIGPTKTSDLVVGTDPDWVESRTPLPQTVKGLAEVKHVYPHIAVDVAKVFEKMIRAHGRDDPSNRKLWKELYVYVNQIEEVMLVVTVSSARLTILKEIDTLFVDFFRNGEGKKFRVTSFYMTCFYKVGSKNESLTELVYGSPSMEVMRGLYLHFVGMPEMWTSLYGLKMICQGVDELLCPDKNTTVLEVFCGTGLLGQFLSKIAGQVLAYDDTTVVKPAVKTARKNVASVHYFSGEPETELVYQVKNAKFNSIVAVVNWNPGFPRDVPAKQVMKVLRRMKVLRKLVVVTHMLSLARISLNTLCGSYTPELGEPFLPVKTIPLDTAPLQSGYTVLILFERHLDKGRSVPKLVQRPRVKEEWWNWLYGDKRDDEKRRRQERRDAEKKKAEDGVEQKKRLEEEMKRKIQEEMEKTRLLDLERKRREEEQQSREAQEKQRKELENKEKRLSFLRKRLKVEQKIRAKTDVEPEVKPVLTKGKKKQPAPAEEKKPLEELKLHIEQEKVRMKRAAERKREEKKRRVEAEERRRLAGEERQQSLQVWEAAPLLEPADPLWLLEEERLRRLKEEEEEYRRLLEEEAYRQVEERKVVFDYHHGGPALPSTPAPTPLLEEPRVGSFKSRVGSFEPRVGSFEPRVGSFEPRVGSFEPKVGSFEPRVGSFESGIGSFESRIGSIEPRVGSLEPRVGSFEPRVGSFESKPESFEPRVRCLEPRVGNFEPKAESLEPRSGSMEPAPPAGRNAVSKPVMKWLEKLREVSSSVTPAAASTSTATPPPSLMLPSIRPLLNPPGLLSSSNQTDMQQPPPLLPSYNMYNSWGSQYNH